jgi:hypothetical protein
VRKCPRCGSEKVHLEEYMGAKCLVCDSCSFDERETYLVYPEEDKNQKEKGRYSPYKAGGKDRTSK